MSELKARRAYFSEDEYERGAHKICAKVSDCGYDRKNDWWSYAFEDEVYIKSEADKVIAHNKFKRCLDKAGLCESEEKRLEAIAPLFDTDKECWEYGSDYWKKWHKRWLQLAEQVKAQA